MGLKAIETALLLVLFVVAACGGGGGAETTSKPLLSAGTELDLIRISEAVWAREAKVGVKTLSAAERVFLSVWNLEAEVNNGGFEQYYMNSAGDNALETPGALREIGATQAAAIVEEANSLFGPSGPPADRDARTRALESLGKTATDAFETLDTRFQEYPDNLEDLLRQFVDRRREQFHEPQ
jgi:hypothetical protein